MSASESEFVFRLPRRTLQIAAIAFGIGFLLFVIVWLRGRNDGFYQPQATPEGPKTVVEALPEPLPARGGASGMEEPTSEGNETPQLVEVAPMPESIEDDEATAAPSAEETSAAPPPALATGDVAEIQIEQSPPPAYPASAMRRGESGIAMVRVDVGVDGLPSNVAIETGSGSRELDRAALDAVRKWHFRAAQRDGQPIPSSVVVPVEFKLQ
ncbi:TonB family protein [Pseudoxanthomonas indica]|uniref:Outer membrane transport energization protein TonB n=1 Tax=Pseudoxanthomonas indica TaxID=428993 RepID=A0A1T5LYN2_9GAMM|nr:TonB family protein [Pseudoxanthomonas indica]GGD42309.1 energry transducer TonB [Pseudoxanthomonas indica]SKC80965.1 outer membrane transport energization protein TonB [Pseudoxanthomonas indica]